MSTVSAQQAYRNRSVMCKSEKAARDAMRRAGKPCEKLGGDRHPDPRGKHEWGQSTHFHILLATV